MARRSVYLLSSLLLLFVYTIDTPAQEDAFFEEIRGVVAEIDPLNGVVRLEPKRVAAVVERTEFLDGPTGEEIDVEDLEIGQHLVIRALWTRQGEAIALQVVRDGEQPPHVPPKTLTASSMWGRPKTCRAA